MNTALALAANDSTDADLGSTTAVIFDFQSASTPKSALAREIASIASERLNAPKKQGGLKDYQVTRTDIFHVNPYLIQIKPGLNSREMNSPATLAHIDSLARSIAAIGVQEPLKVFTERDGVTYVSNGECRLLATFRAIEVYGANILAIPVRTVGRNASQLDIISSQFTGNAGLRFTPFELGTAFKKALDQGASLQQVADIAGMSTVRVTQILELRAGATPEIKALINAGKVSPSMAWRVIKANGGDSDKAFGVLESAVENARAAGRHRASPKHAPKAKVEAYKVSRKDVADLIHQAKKVQGRDGVTLAFDNDLYAKLAALVGL